MRYEGQAGVFLRRDTKVASMPYLGKQEDGEYIFGSCVACTEVTPDGKVYVMIEETDYREEPVEVDSEEGQGLLKDAIAGEFCGKNMEILERA